MSVNSKMTAIADEIRDLSGTTGSLSLDAMASTLRQVSPSISINSTNGLVTATVGAKTATHQLAFQAAKTITPGTTSQIAVSSGYFTGGNITVTAIPSTYVQPTGTKTITTNGTYDIKGYASVKVSVSDGGGTSGNTSMEDILVTRTMTSYTNDRVTTIGSCAFYSCSKLTAVSFPAVTTIGNHAFALCTGLPAVSFPAATTIGSYAFYYCYNLTAVNFPAATTISSCAFSACSRLTTVNFPAAATIGSYVFNDCFKLTTASFPAATTIGTRTFGACYNLKSLYLMGPSLCKLSTSNAFSSTPIGGYSVSAGTYGSIYVPASLLTSYQTATNWTYFSSRFVGI